MDLFKNKRWEEDWRLLLAYLVVAGKNDIKFPEWQQ